MLMPRRRRMHVAPLTRRQTEVAALLADGLTNREIAGGSSFPNVRRRATSSRSETSLDSTHEPSRSLVCRDEGAADAARQSWRIDSRLWPGGWKDRPRPRPGGFPKLS